MIGRGILMDPTLALQLKGEVLDEYQRTRKLKEFHDRLFQEYADRLQGSGHLLTKMTQFWSYFSYSFENQHKAFKLIKKAGSLIKYNAAVAQIFKG
jgi:tRNA-dihydrouridine synthase